MMAKIGGIYNDDMEDFIACNKVSLLDVRLKEVTNGSHDTTNLGAL